MGGGGGGGSPAAYSQEVGLGKSRKDRQMVMAFRVLPTKTVTIPPGEDRTRYDNTGEDEG